MAGSANAACFRRTDGTNVHPSCVRKLITPCVVSKIVHGGDGAISAEDKAGCLASTLGERVLNGEEKPDKLQKLLTNEKKKPRNSAAALAIQAIESAAAAREQGRITHPLKEGPMLEIQGPKLTSAYGALENAFGRLLVERDGELVLNEKTQPQLRLKAIEAIKQALVAGAEPPLLREITNGIRVLELYRTLEPDDYFVRVAGEAVEDIRRVCFPSCQRGR